MGRYGIKEVFLTLQGEGLRTGTKAVFVRFSGCNLWDGHPLHRDKGAGPCAQWCDTDFFKGTVTSTEELLAQMNAQWPSRTEERWCVLTGGEPTLQLDAELVTALRAEGWHIAIETNGTLANEALHGVHHVCLSPKRGTDWHNILGTCRIAEVKVILPGALALSGGGWAAEELTNMRAQVLHSCAPLRTEFFVQPQDPLVDGTPEVTHLRRKPEPLQEDAAQSRFLEEYYKVNVAMCVGWINEHPEWRLSLQTHKTIELP